MPRSHSSTCAPTQEAELASVRVREAELVDMLAALGLGTPQASEQAAAPVSGDEDVQMPDLGAAEPEQQQPAAEPAAEIEPEQQAEPEPQQPEQPAAEPEPATAEPQQPAAAQPEQQPTPAAAEPAPLDSAMLGAVLAAARTTGDERPPSIADLQPAVLVVSKLLGGGMLERVMPVWQRRGGVVEAIVDARVLNRIQQELAARPDASWPEVYEQLRTAVAKIEPNYKPLEGEACRAVLQPLESFGGVFTTRARPSTPAAAGVWDTEVQVEAQYMYLVPELRCDTPYTVRQVYAAAERKFPILRASLAIQPGGSKRKRGSYLAAGQRCGACRTCANKQSKRACLNPLPSSPGGKRAATGGTRQSQQVRAVSTCG